MNNDLYEEYAEFCRGTAIYPDAHNFNPQEAMYLGLGLAGEAGEVANNIKKLYRDGFESDLGFVKNKKELGDVLWYFTRLCDFYKTSIPELMVANMRKLQDRKERGVLGGSGDER